MEPKHSGSVVSRRLRCGGRASLLLLAAFLLVSARGQDSRLRPARESAGPCSTRTPLVISEIHYHPGAREDGRRLAFVEVYNSDPVPHDLGGFSLNGDIDYTFPAGTLINATSHVVVAAVPADVQAVYGKPALGPFAGSFGNGGGTLRLRDSRNAMLLEVRFSDRAPWPVAADGLGHSLVLVRPTYGETHPFAWESSTHPGGSPGVADPVLDSPRNGLRINEILAHPAAPGGGYVELYNLGTSAVDAGGMVITDGDPAHRMVLPGGMVLAPGAFRAVTVGELGFPLSPGGGRVVLLDTNPSRVVDAWAYGAQAPGEALGHVPDGTGDPLPLADRTPGGPNGRARRGEVVINEIMYQPLSGRREHCYLELKNRSAAPVDLGGWKLKGGIDFSFAPGTLIPANGYLVVADNQAALLARYPGVLSAANTVGNFNGSLGRGGDRITLERPADPLHPGTNRVRVDEVTYVDGGRWPRAAAGAGSSLELIDDRADGRWAANWAASSEAPKAAWTTLAATGLLEQGRETPNELQVYLLGEGEMLLDEISVQKQTAPGSFGPNLIPNPSFVSGLAGWLLQGNHQQSRRETADGTDGSHCLRLVASSLGDNGANRIEADLSAALAPGDQVRIQLKARWVRGYPLLVARLHGNWFTLAGEVPAPAMPGTPGAANSRAGQTGPAITDVSHDPAEPAAGGVIHVQARVDDPDGLAVVNLRYLVEPATAYATLAMRDDGTGGDLLAGDGLYTGQIPGRPAGSMVVFFVEAADGAGAVGRFPDDAPGRTCLVRVGEPALLPGFPTTRFWLTTSNVNAWAADQTLSNARRDGTLVHNRQRIIYNCEGRYYGSPFRRPTFLHPVTGGSTPKFNWDLPTDDRLWGTDALVLNGRTDPSQLGEKIAFQFCRNLGLAASHVAFLQLYHNGVRQGPIYESIQQVDREFIRGWFPDDNDGEFYKLNDWHEFDDSVAQTLREHADLELFTRSGGVKDRDRYRIQCPRGSPRVPGDDYTEFLALIDAFNLPPGDAYTAAVESVIDVEQWMRVMAARHLSGDWDGLGFDRGKNCFIYKPAGARWQMFTWDYERSFGISDSLVPTSDLKQTVSTAFPQFYNHPPFERMYYNVLLEATADAMLPAKFDVPVNQWAAAMVAAGVSTSDAIVTTMKNYVATRRTNVLARLAAYTSVPFAVTTAGGGPLATGTTPVTLAGTAPVGVFSLRVNGVQLPVKWVTTTAWQVSVPLITGANVLTFQGHDSGGRPLPGMTDGITVNLEAGTHTLERMARDLAVTELMYHPVDDGLLDGDEFEFLELKNIGPDPLDLSGLEFLSGIEFRFTNRTILSPGAFFLLARNPVAFNLRYPGVTVDGAYGGGLDNGGETLTLGYPLAGQVVWSFGYGDRTPWPMTADGHGFSLVRVGGGGVATATDPDAWQASAFPGGSPRAEDPSVDRPPVLVAEALTGDPAGGFVELFNPGGAAAGVGGWFLTDDPRSPRKFILPPGSMIPAGGRLVIPAADLAAGPSGFVLGALGGGIHLFSGDGVNLTGHGDGFEFGPAVAGESFGRHVNSAGEVEFVAMSSVTAGAANPAPRVGPVVISEILYHPPDVAGTDNVRDEYLEVANISDAPVPLWVITPGMGGVTNTWRLRGGVDFEFPPGTMLPPGGRLLVVGFDPSGDPGALAAFRADRGVAPGVPVFGPWRGRLDNSAERVELQRPEVVAGGGVGYALVEGVGYRDAAPWPSAADGVGNALQRAAERDYGNEPLNWFAAGATPGAGNAGTVLPVVTATAPVGGSVFQRPVDVLLAAEATDPDGAIARVEFHVGTRHLSTLTAPPFHWTWMNAPTGRHELRVRAVDQLGAAALSEPVVFTIRSQPPAIALTAPVHQAVLIAGNTVPLTVSGSDSDGTIESVDYLIDDLVVATATNAPFGASWLAQAGYHQVTAVARDNSGERSTSAPVAVQVQAALIGKVTLVASNSAWRYLDNGSNQGTNWIQPWFNDAAWSNGVAQFGYGDNDERTVLRWGTNTANRHLTYYFRRQFVVGTLVGATNALLRVLRDDGAVGYLNGVEVYRSNMTNGPIAYTNRALLTVGGADENTFFGTNVPPALLVEGTNTLAIEVHQQAPNSPDLSFDAEFSIQTFVLGPAILAGPESLTRPAGESATFSVVAGGTPTLTYSWRFNGVPLPGAVGPVLTRTNLTADDAGDYTVVVANPLASITSSVARLTVTPRDTDHDGLPDDWELAHGLDPNLDDADLDLDGDGLSNEAEFVACTDPADRLSVLRLDGTGRDGGRIVFSFTAEAGCAYDLQSRPVLGVGTWQRARTYSASPVRRVITVTNDLEDAGRYFRVITPARP